MKYKILFFLIIVFTFCGCKTKIGLDDPLLELAISNSWAKDTCANNIRNELADMLVDRPASGLNKDIIIAWFGKPVHRHILKNEDYIFIYHHSGYPNSASCPYGNLLCARFNKHGNLQKMYPFFIVEDMDTTLFWYSGSTPPVSYEAETKNKFFLSIPR